jgi:hypothetical protein
MKKIIYQSKSEIKNVEEDVILPKYPIYYIKWIDAFTETDEWHTLDSITSTDYTCETIGFLIPNNRKNYYTIASTLSVDDHYASLINIPKNMITVKKIIRLL